MRPCVCRGGEGEEEGCRVEPLAGVPDSRRKDRLVVGQAEAEQIVDVRAVGQARARDADRIEPGEAVGLPIKGEAQLVALTDSILTFIFSLF